MQRWLLILGLSTGLPAHADEPQAITNPVATAALKAEAADAAQQLGAALKTELDAALRAGGPVSTLAVCRVKAPVIAGRISSESGIRVSRTSLKPRNPDNAPNKWQTAVLRTFEARKAAGEEPARLSHAEIVDDEFRFMKAIPTVPVCLACHGERLAPELSARLAELYPHDQATGFREGDLRGAFVIVKRLPIRP